MHSSLLDSLQRLHSDLRQLTSSSLNDYQKDAANALKPNNHGFFFRLSDSISRTWDLGFTAFGGPPVLFQIVHRRFVEGKGDLVPWVDEQTVRCSEDCRRLL